MNQNGAPIIHVSSGCAYSYDPELLTWIKLSEKWWAGGSSVWQARSRTGTVTANRGVVATIENVISEQTGPDDGANRERSKWWEAALTLGHLETKLQATKVLESPTEYKQVLLVYAKRIAEDGFRGKAEELVKELFGPLYWCVLARLPMAEWNFITSVGDQEGTIRGHQHCWDSTNVNFSVKC